MAKGIFEVNSSLDKYKLLLKQYDFYKENMSSSFRALAFCETAWSLTEWIYKEHEPLHSQIELGKFRAELYLKCPFLKIMHDIANMSKHMTLSRPKSKISNTRKQGGAFSAAFTLQFQKTHLIIEMENGTIYDVDEVIDSVFDLWINYFKTVLKIKQGDLRIPFEELHNL